LSSTTNLASAAATRYRDYLLRKMSQRAALARKSPPAQLPYDTASKLGVLLSSADAEQDEAGFSLSGSADTRPLRWSQCTCRSPGRANIRDSLIEGHGDLSRRDIGI
jgi:hypothetical protein